MADAPAVDALARLTAAPQPPSSRLLGSEPLDVDPARGFARITFTVDDRFCTYMGFVHGGFLAAMLDECMAIAAVAQHDYQRAVPTLAMKVSYLQPARPGRLIAEAEVVRAGRELVFLEGRLFDANGNLLTTASATARYAKQAVL